MAKAGWRSPGEVWRAYEAMAAENVYVVHTATCLRVAGPTNAVNAERWVQEHGAERHHLEVGGRDLI